MPSPRIVISGVGSSEALAAYELALKASGVASDAMNVVSNVASNVANNAALAASNVFLQNIANTLNIAIQTQLSANGYIDCGYF